MAPDSQLRDHRPHHRHVEGAAPSALVGWWRGRSMPGADAAAPSKRPREAISLRPARAVRACQRRFHSAATGLQCCTGRLIHSSTLGLSTRSARDHRRRPLRRRRPGGVGGRSGVDATVRAAAGHRRRRDACRHRNRLGRGRATRGAAHRGGTPGRDGAGGRPRRLRHLGGVPRLSSGPVRLVARDVPPHDDTATDAGIGPRAVRRHRPDSRRHRLHTRAERRRALGALLGTDSAGWCSARGRTTNSSYWLQSEAGRAVDLLPFNYLLDEGRWVPTQDVFLLPPGVPMASNTGLWNGNCANCHSVDERTATDRGRRRRHPRRRARHRLRGVPWPGRGARARPHQPGRALRAAPEQRGRSDDRQPGPALGGAWIAGVRPVSLGLRLQKHRRVGTDRAAVPSRRRPVGGSLPHQPAQPACGIAAIRRRLFSPSVSGRTAWFGCRGGSIRGSPPPPASNAAASPAHPATRCTTRPPTIS